MEIGKCYVATLKDKSAEISYIIKVENKMECTYYTGPYLHIQKEEFYPYMADFYSCSYEFREASDLETQWMELCISERRSIRRPQGENYQIY